MTHVLIGIDDTDNLVSRGTGHRARQLIAALSDAGVEPLAVTRHQLLVDPRIPYTSHNSSACLEVRCDVARIGELVSRSREFLLRECAEGADAGLCVARYDQATDDIRAFGLRAKRDIVRTAEAHLLAEAGAIHLEGLTGTRIGVIGALAGVGLRAGGSDGRLLWMPGLRDLEGIVPAAALYALGVHRIETEQGVPVPPAARVDVGTWPRPIMRAGRIVLLVEENQTPPCEWRLIPKTRIKELSA